MAIEVEAPPKDAVDYAYQALRHLCNGWVNFGGVHPEQLIRVLTMFAVDIAVQCGADFEKLHDHIRALEHDIRAGHHKAKVGHS